MSSHQHVIDGWDEVLAMIAASRLTTEHPDAHTCLDALELMAKEHSAFMTERKAELDAAHADDTTHE